MQSQLLGFFLVFVCIHTCISEASFDTGNREVLSTQGNEAIKKLEEDVIQFNIAKRETIPKVTVRNRKNRKGNKIKSQKKGKRSNRKQRKGAKRNNRHGEKKNSTKKEKRRNIQNHKKKSSKRDRRKNRQRNQKGKRKNRKGNKKKSLKDRKKKSSQSIIKGKKKNKQGNKSTLMKTRHWKNKQRNQKQNVKNRQQRANCNTAQNASITIHTAIKTNKKYLSHGRMIKRTKKWLNTMAKKSQKLKRYREAADWLEKVSTDNGTRCPGDHSLSGKMIQTIEELRQCGSNTTKGTIVESCSKTKIANVTNLEKAINVCVVLQSGTTKPYSTYGLWTGNFSECKDCDCYANMNGNNNLYDKPPYSCKNPNQNDKDWIKTFNEDTFAVFNGSCTPSIQTCKETERQAANLTSICSTNSMVGGSMTTPGTGRRLKIKASMIKQLNRMKIY